MGQPCLDGLHISVLGNPAAKGILGEVTMLPDQVLLTNARLCYTGLVQPLDVVQAQPFCVWTLLICSTTIYSGLAALLSDPMWSLVTLQGATNNRIIP